MVTMPGVGSTRKALNAWRMAIGGSLKMLLLRTGTRDLLRSNSNDLQQLSRRKEGPWGYIKIRQNIQNETPKMSENALSVSVSVSV